MRIASLFSRISLCDRILEQVTNEGERTMWTNWRCLGFCALTTGLSILLVSLLPIGGLMLFISFLLIFCGFGCMRRR